jgi:hypothetical protein
MRCEQVEGPLKPVSTATSDQEVGHTADAEDCPGAQIHPLVDLRLAPYLKAAEVRFEAHEVVPEYFTIIRRNIGTPFAY